MTAQQREQEHKSLCYNFFKIVKKAHPDLHASVLQEIENTKSVESIARVVPDDLLIRQFPII